MIVSRDGPQVVAADELGSLVTALRNGGFTVIGPRVDNDAIVLDEIISAAELPHGWGVTVEPGGYRLRLRTDPAVFGHSAGPQSWKPYLYPARRRLWSARRDDDDAGFVVEDEQEEAPRYAFLGVRPCDLHAIGVLDTVLTGGPHPDPTYVSRRADLFIVAVNCTEPCATCFCASMGTGPGAESGYDLALTELVGEDGGDGHRFVVDVGSDAGARILAEVPHRPADSADVDRARQDVVDAADRMGRSIETDGIRELLAESHDARRWDDVASRCLTCGNCTMVCPTCFCTTVEDVTDVSGQHAERWLRWDSCFDLDFSHLPGGSVRTSGRSRYRQWLTHKLGTWYDQFGSSGCVGCGRCIVWCPVGIDITEEVHALREERADHGSGDVR